jgi:hypothetical protein
MHGKLVRRFLTTATALQFALALAAPPPDPLIEAARKAAAAYQNSLPDYVARRTTARYNATPHRLDVTIWKPVDTVTGEVTAVHGKELYSNITINGNPAAKLPNWGAWSAGEFATVLMAILPRERAATFTHQRSEQLRNRAAARYDFAVDQLHSAWSLAADRLPGAPGPPNYFPACAGAIWIDKQTGQVLRVEMSARGLPNWFALSSIESRTDFDFVQIGDREYLLPSHSESLSCKRNGFLCLKNETVFTNYDKFVSDTNISFDNTAK